MVVLVVAPPTPMAFCDSVPLRFAVTTYPITGEPELAVAAVQLTVAWVGPAVAVTSPASGGSGRLRCVVTTYPITGEPELAVAAVQLTVAWLAPAVAVTPPAAVGWL